MLKFIYKIVGIFFCSATIIYILSVLTRKRPSDIVYVYKFLFHYATHFNHSIIFELKEYKLWIKLVRNIICMLKYTPFMIG
jgi:hypothetical protein